MPKAHDFKFLVEIGARLQIERERQDLTQAEVCKRAKISPQQLSRYELGLSDAPISTLKRICKALGMNITALLVQTAAGDP
jgi:transcriptional regulator with XRE-family HTH domain